MRLGIFWLEHEQEQDWSLGLNDQEEDALVAFMQTLTDGYTPAQK
jgi:hypothetical protein